MMFLDNHEYDDIINLPHHVSKKHPQMDLLDRAAQFSPFAALTGFEAALEETGRLTEERMELDEDTKEMLDRCFREIREHLVSKSSEKPAVNLTFFQADALKDGGAYVTFTGRVKKIDENARKIVFEDGMTVRMDDVVDMRTGL